MNAIGALLTLAACSAVFALPRRSAALAFVAATLYITQGQALDLGINFMAIRFVELAAFLRVILRRDLYNITFTDVDRWMLLFAVTPPIISAFRVGTLEAYDVGLAVDACFVYFSFRALIRTFDDLAYLLKRSVLLLLPIAVMMAEEARSGHNYFSLLGGVPEQSVYREGHFRAQAGFRISITAGSLGATWAALFVAFLFKGSTRWWAFLGILACVVILISSHSSGPLMAACAAIVAWGCWIVRHRMTLVRRGIVFVLLVLHMLMSKPVWFIFDRISGIVGGDGWHRSNLIDKFFKDFAEWGLVGMPIEATGDWAATKMPWGGVDVTNFYIAVGIDGGLISFVFIFIFLTKLFKLLGRANALLRTVPEDSVYLQTVLWGVGCTVTAHVINLTSVVYWDQFYVIWYCHLAIAVSMCAHVIKSYPPTETVASDDDVDVELSTPRPAS